MSETPPMTLARIVEEGLCAGCGLCQSEAPEHVRMVMTPAGFLRPRSERPLSAEMTRRIDAICPGIRVTGLSPAERSPDGHFDPVWGPWLRFGRVHAADPEVRFRGSSGGMLTALGTWMLETGRADRIVHVAMSAERPLRSSVRVSADRAAVEQAAGSRYGPSATLSNLGDVLDSGLRFALVGKPCDVAGVRNLARVDPRVKQQCTALLSFTCGGVSALSKTAEALNRWGLEEHEVEVVRHRGHGCPGRHHIRTRDGRVFEMDGKELWIDFSDWRLQQRCKVCPDAIAEGADLVASDAWPGGIPGDDPESVGGFILRTERGRALFDDALADGILVVDRIWGPRDFDVIQPYHVRLREALPGRLEGLRLAGQTPPRTENLRLDTPDGPGPPEVYARERDGLLARAKAGKTVEPPAVSADGP